MVDVTTFPTSTSPAGLYLLAIQVSQNPDLVPNIAYKVELGSGSGMVALWNDLEAEIQRAMSAEASAVTAIGLVQNATVTAQTAANAAQSTANSANTLAGSAMTAANTAQGAANAAQSTANAANTLAASAQSGATAAQSSANAANLLAAAAIPSSQIGQSNGVAPLDGTGQIPLQYLSRAAAKLPINSPLIGSDALGNPTTINPAASIAINNGVMSVVTGAVGSVAAYNDPRITNALQPDAAGKLPASLVATTANLASLRLYNYALLSNYAMIEMLNAGSGKDYGGGRFYWDATSNDIDDLGTVINPTGNQFTQAASAAQTGTGTTILLSNTTGIVAGQLVTGTGIASGTTVASFVANTSVTLSAATTSAVAQGATITFLQTGRWRRMRYIRDVLIDWFAPNANGTTNDQPAFAYSNGAVGQTGGRVLLNPTKSYLVSGFTPSANCEFEGGFVPPPGRARSSPYNGNYSLYGSRIILPANQNVVVTTTADVAAGATAIPVSSITGIGRGWIAVNYPFISYGSNVNGTPSGSTINLNQGTRQFMPSGTSITFCYNGISCGDGIGFRGCIFHRQGMAFPPSTDIPTASAEVNSWANYGTAITLTGQDQTIERCMFLGFGYAIVGGLGRQRLLDLMFDCWNGFAFGYASDVPHIQRCQGFSFYDYATTPTQYKGGVAFGFYGSIDIKTVDLFAYGWQTTFLNADCNNCYHFAGYADTQGLISGAGTTTYGYRVTGTSTDVKHIGCQADSQTISYSYESVAETSGGPSEIIGCRAIGCTSLNAFTADFQMLSGAVFLDAPSIGCTISTAAQPFIIGSAVTYCSITHPDLTNKTAPSIPAFAVTGTPPIYVFGGRFLGYTNNLGNRVATAFQNGLQTDTLKATTSIAVGTPTWTSGTGAPTSTQPNASIYTRSDGTTGSRLYVSTGSAWNAVAGV